MGRNLAIVERPAAQEATCYTWAFPGSPVQVQLTLTVVEQLQKQTSGAEGLLLGKTVGHTTEIHDFQVLSGGSEQAAAAAIETAGASRAMGYYRIARDAGLRLSESDAKLFETLFPGRHQVFLQVQPSDAGAANSTFFFWDQGRVCGDFPFLEFPMDAALLAAAEQQRIEALHRKMAEALMPREKAAVVRPQGRGITAKLLLWSFAMLLLATLGVAVAIRMKWMPEKYWTKLARTGQVAAPVPAVQPREAFFGLQAERQNGDLRLTWNREAPVVLTATSGVLDIVDGTSSRKITLDPVQVRSGSILYAPSTDQVQMQLSVLTAAGMVSESVLVLLPKTGAPKTQMVSQKVVPAASLSAESPAAPLKPFTAPPATRSAPANPQITEPPPTVRPTATAALPAALTPRLSPAALPTAEGPKRAVAPEPAPTAAAAESPTYTGPIVSGKVVPPFPSYLRSVVMKPTTVEIKVTIDATGKVVKADLADSSQSAPPSLVAAAVNAARLWRFKPAHKGTEPIPSEQILQFVFRPPNN